MSSRLTLLAVLLASIIVAGIAFNRLGSDTSDTTAESAALSPDPGDSSPVDSKLSDPDHDIPSPDADNHEDYDPPVDEGDLGRDQGDARWSCHRQDGSGQLAIVDAPSPAILADLRDVAIAAKVADPNWKPVLDGFPPDPGPDCVPDGDLPSWEEWTHSRSIFAVLNDEGHVVNEDGSLTIVDRDGTVRVEEAN